VPAEVRVFKADADTTEDAEHPQTGMRGSYRGKTGRGGLWWARRFMTHRDILRPSIAALRKIYSITSSARLSNVGGSVRPSALAVCRLMSNSKRVGNSSGSSAGRVP
jgi:hypothetical protein